MTTLDLTLESVTVTIDGKRLEFFPLNFKALRVLSGELDALRSGDQAPIERMNAICKLLAASANRRIQQISEDELVELLDPVCANQILGEVNKLSGFVKVDKDHPTRPLNGGESTQVLSVQPDGVGSKLTS